jgi:hypothetical protein
VNLAKQVITDDTFPKRDESIHKEIYDSINAIEYAISATYKIQTIISLESKNT